MLLDEPSNHLDIESLIWLEQFLKNYEGALMMTSHDRAFMNRIVTKVVEIDGGTLTSYSGNYEFYAEQRALADKQQQAQFERQQAMLAKEIQFIERFKARASHAAQVQSRVKKLEKIDRVEPPRRRQTVAFEFQTPPRSGEDVVSLKGVHKAYGARTIYEGLDFSVRRRERWCVMGMNGAGKSTLLKLVTGSTEPDAGSVTLGGSVKMAYFAQHAMELLEGEHTVFESLEDSFPQAGQGSLRALAGCFGFSGDDVEKRCRVLSGGEKARLVMAKMLFDPPNFLVLDEPTNHLDMATKEMLIDALANYEGTMLFVSHDRHFLAACRTGCWNSPRTASTSMAAATPNMWPAPARKRRPAELMGGGAAFEQGTGPWRIKRLALFAPCGYERQTLCISNVDTLRAARRRAADDRRRSKMGQQPRPAHSQHLCPRTLRPRGRER